MNEKIDWAFVLSDAELVKTAKETKYSREALARKFKRTTRTLEREFRRITGKSVSVRLCEIRLDASIKLLKQGMTVKATAVESGFKQSSHFCRCFKKYFNKHPSDVRPSKIKVGRSDSN